MSWQTLDELVHQVHRWRKRIWSHRGGWLVGMSAAMTVDRLEQNAGKKSSLNQFWVISWTLAEVTMPPLKVVEVVDSWHR